MSHTLITFLGKGGAKDGYRTTTYRFSDRDRQTRFFGLALAEQLRPDRIVILGTRGSMWGVLVEHVGAGRDGEEDARLALMDAEKAEAVDQALIERVTPFIQVPGGAQIIPRVIPYGRTPEEQQEILKTISDVVESGEVSFDLTHGFRQLGMVGMLSAFMLERIGHLRVSSLWYGAWEMTDQGITPVLRLDGMHAIQRWVSALDRFDASGDYGVFADLLRADGVPSDKVRCLEEASFHERTFNLSGARAKLQTFLKAIEQPLSGASGLFQEKLQTRLQWANGGNLAAWQRQLTDQYLERGDFVRAAVFAWEALISHACGAGKDPQDWEVRDAARNALDDRFRATGCEPELQVAYRDLKNLRNALAHGNPPTYQRLREILASPEDLREALLHCIRLLLPPSQACEARRDA